MTEKIAEKPTSTSTSTPSGTAVEFRGVTKRYGAMAAVQNVNLTIRRGEVHALVGANGAGKSTLLGILAGRTAATDGDVRVFGQPLTTGHPRESKAAGISVVYQELTVLPALTACANVFLGNEQVRAGLLDEREMRTRYEARCEDFGIDIPATTLGRELSVASEQMLEIMRAVELDARILILDEPTAALSHKERKFLLELVKRLKASGVTIMLVTHNLDEVLDVSDTITVMREGQIVDQAPVDAWTKRSMVQVMTGKQELLQVVRDRSSKASHPVVFSARNVTLPGAIEGISVEVRAGEVLGLAGLVGAGRTSLLRSLAGAESKATGAIVVNGVEFALPRNPREALRRGIALLPENRKTEGLALGMSIGDNVTLPMLERVSRIGLVSGTAQLSAAKEMLTQFTLQRPVGTYPVGELSGGGQQKVVFGKLLLADPEVLLIDEPTRGIDVAAKVEVLQAVRHFAEEKQRAVIITSTEIDEVIDVADRIVIMAFGRAVGELDNTSHQVAVQDVLRLSFGVDEEEE